MIHYTVYFHHRSELEIEKKLKVLKFSKEKLFVKEIEVQKNAYDYSERKFGEYTNGPVVKFLSHRNAVPFFNGNYHRENFFFHDLPKVSVSK